jgi:hypothetical protein
VSLLILVLFKAKLLVFCCLFATPTTCGASCKLQPLDIPNAVSCAPVLLLGVCAADRVMAVVEDSVQFADESPKPEKGQLLENVFADPRGFGIAADGRYRYELPGFTSGTAQVS